MNLKPANILSCCRIRRLAKEGCEAAHNANIIALRIGSQAAHRHVFEHALPQRTNGAFDRRNRHRMFLIMMKGTPCSRGKHAPLKASSKTHSVTRSTNPAKRVRGVPSMFDSLG